MIDFTDIVLGDIIFISIYSDKSQLAIYAIDIEAEPKAVADGIIVKGTLCSTSEKVKIKFPTLSITIGDTCTRYRNVTAIILRAIKLETDVPFLETLNLCQKAIYANRIQDRRAY